MEIYLKKSKTCPPDLFQPERIVYKMKTGKSYGVYEKYE